MENGHWWRRFPTDAGTWYRCPFQLSRSERYSPPKYDIEQSDAGCNFAHNSLIPFRLAFMNRQHARESTFNLKGGYMISQGSREHEISTLESTITYPVYSRHDVCRRLWVSRLPFFKLDDERRVGGKRTRKREHVNMWIQGDQLYASPGSYAWYVLKEVVTSQNSTWRCQSMRYLNLYLKGATKLLIEKTYRNKKKNPPWREKIQDKQE